jgi:GMP synthase (glutamine-hydrolysing)
MTLMALVHHNPQVTPGRLEPHLSGHDVVEVWAGSGNFPSHVGAAVVMGGFMGAYESTEHPWLIREAAWLESLVSNNVPVLGICLGAQLLAHALGGRAFRAPVPEVGVMQMSLTQAGTMHPVVSAAGPRALFAHQDTFEPPPGATLLAETSSYPAAFEMGSALALQYHPETRLEVARGWVDDPDFDMLDRVGLPPEAFLSQLTAFADEADERAEAMFSAWFHDVARPQRPHEQAGSIAADDV